MFKLPSVRVLGRTFLLAFLASPACHRTPAPALPRRDTPAGHDALPDFAVNAVDTHEGKAFWYDVPARSLAQRRAWAGELTAASDTLPLGSYVRVRRLDDPDSHEAIVVHITDTGVHRKGGLVDLNREAAEALGMVKAGEARVRVETLALKNATAGKPMDKKSAPAVPKASDFGKPAASEQAEKEAASAKQDGK